MAGKKKFDTSSAIKRLEKLGIFDEEDKKEEKKKKKKKMGEGKIPKSIKTIKRRKKKYDEM